MNRSASASAPENLAAFVERHQRLFVLTGAGCSTESGIPDYRDHNGDWKRKPPVMFASYMSDPLTRARYWARSLVGWPHFHAARPNAPHPTPRTPHTPHRPHTPTPPTSANVSKDVNNRIRCATWPAPTSCCTPSGYGSSRRSWAIGR